MNWILAISTAGLTALTIYLWRELQAKTEALETCHRLRIQDRTASERTNQRLAESLASTAAALRDFAHGLRIRRLTRPVVLPSGKP